MFFTIPYVSIVHYLKHESELTKNIFSLHFIQQQIIQQHIQAEKMITEKSLAIKAGLTAKESEIIKEYQKLHFDEVQKYLKFWFQPYSKQRVETKFF